MIHVQNLIKHFGQTHAVNDITFEIPKGHIVGFLGPNGAGKTTTLRMITGYLPPSSGKITVADHNILTQQTQARRQIGYLPEHTPLYQEMRVNEYLHYRGKLMSMPRKDRIAQIASVHDKCGLSKIINRTIGQLSKGNKQRVGLAQALLHKPQVIILDEPGSGLDPSQITQVREMIRNLKGDHTVLLSSHILPEVEKITDRVIIIANGKIVADGTPTQLRKQVTKGASIILETNAPHDKIQKMLHNLNEIQSITTTQTSDQWTRAIITPTQDSQNIDLRQTIGNLALQNQWLIREIRHETASLEQFFVNVTQTQIHPQG